MAAIINLDKVKYPDVVTAKNGSTKLENGALVAIGGLVPDRLGRDCYQIEALKEGCILGLVADVALMADETKDERDFVLEAGQITRVYRVKSGQAVTIAEVNVGTVAVGDELEVKAGAYTLQKVTTGKPVARVLEKYNFEGQASVYIEFL